MNRKSKAPMNQRPTACPSCGNVTNILRFDIYGACPTCGTAWYFTERGKRRTADLGSVLDAAVMEFDAWTPELRQAFGLEGEGIIIEPCQSCLEAPATDGVYCAACAEREKWFPPTNQTFIHGADTFAIGTCSICAQEKILNQHKACDECWTAERSAHHAMQIAQAQAAAAEQRAAQERLEAESYISDIDEAESADDYRYS